MGENRHRHTVWMDDAVWDQVESHYQKDNCSTKNEYIEKAIQFEVYPMSRTILNFRG